jgi:hypothetical protein
MASEYESFAALGYNHSQVKFDVNYVKAEEFIELVRRIVHAPDPSMIVGS